MFIAHAPVGYILGTGIAARMGRLPISGRAVILICIAGSLLPDLDLLYFYLVDQRRTPHHHYLTHWPILWGALLAAAFAWRTARKDSRAAFALVLIACCGLLHMLMDTVVGEIRWLAPFVTRSYVLFHVEARFKPWWLNFIFHWSFIVELVLLGWALGLYRQRWKAAHRPADARTGRGS